MNRVLDAGPMIAYLRDEAGGTVVAALLEDPDEHCVAHAVNLARRSTEVLKDVPNCGEREKRLAGHILP